MFSKTYVSQVCDPSHTPRCHQQALPACEPGSRSLPWRGTLIQRLGRSGCPGLWIAILITYLAGSGLPIATGVRASRLAAPVQPAKSVVISQIYGGGGNSGAPWRNDFIELYNTGGETIDLGNWALHYSSATGTTWQRTLLFGSLAPGRRYLVQQASGGANGTPLPTPDLTGTIPLAATAGKIVLTRTTTAIPGGTICPAGSDVVDLAGYGNSANCFEGVGPAPSPGSATAIARIERGCRDTNQNRADFLAVTPAPLNGASPAIICGQPTTPAGVGLARPTPAQAGSPITLEVAVTAGTNPPSSRISVTADLRAIGGAAGQPLSDTGTGADEMAGDGRYVARYSLPRTLAARKYGLEATIRDGEGRESRVMIELEVVAPGPPSPVLISQVYASGGNSGAIYSHDWVELFNRGRDKVDLTGWSVQYATATGSSWSRVDLGGELPAGRYFLIRLGGGSSGAAPPNPDQSANINLSSSGGKILLTRSPGSITTGCPVGEVRADLIGYGNSADCFEGDAPAGAPGAATALIRWGDGCRETDQNRADWRTDQPRPRNTTNQPLDCTSYLATFGGIPGGQYPGSILIYPAYSSLSTSPQGEDTRLTLTNTSPNQHVAVRLFWINGGSAATADSLISLTPNQTVSLLASEIDPDIAGYLISVAVDLQSGRPINFNHLIGSQYLKLTSGHSGNITPVSIRAIESEPVAVDPAAMSGELIFDDNHYQRLPSTLAVGHLPSPITDSDCLLIVDRLEGSLATGLQTVGELRGVIYSDLESAHSFAASSSRRQLRLLINDRAPRVTPRLSAIIPATRAGWMKFARVDGGAIVGALLSRNGNGRVLHLLGLAEEAVIELPLLGG